MSEPTPATEVCPEGQTARLVAEIESLRKWLAAERENYEAAKCEADTLMMDNQELTKQLAAAEARAEDLYDKLIASEQRAERLERLCGEIWDYGIDGDEDDLRAAIAAAKEARDERRI